VVDNYKFYLSVLYMSTYLEFYQNIKKDLLYTTSLYYNLFQHYMGNDWWNYVTDNIMLGAIPLKNYDHHRMLVNNSVNLIISVVEPHEYTDTYLSQPVKQSDWENLGIEFMSFPSPDFNSIDYNMLDRVIYCIINAINQNKKIYVHCKAGKGRSVIVVACYMMLSDPTLTYAKVMKLIRSKRPNISLSWSQKMCISRYYNMIHQINNDIMYDETESVYTDDIV
jgi:protein-tyrosine phosphatase